MNTQRLPGRRLQQKVGGQVWVKSSACAWAECAYRLYDAALASSGKRLVTAVFDSSQVGESFSADEVVVTFVGSADEELIEMANRGATRMVVITSDRRVREAVEKAGAVGLWSEALIDWLRTGGRRTFQS